MVERQISMIIRGGTVVTMDRDRRIIPGGSVAIDRDRIVEANTDENIMAKYRTDQEIDARGKAVLPGLINAHAHVAPILLRGGLSPDRTLFDWLINVLSPGVSRFTNRDAAVATTLFCVESVRRGTTTFVDNANPADDEIIKETIGSFDRCGVRAIYAMMFNDQAAHSSLIEAFKLKEREIKHPLHCVPLEDSESALSFIEQTINKYHGAAGGRISIWPSPGMADLVSEKGYMGALALAGKYNTMVTTHVCETRQESKMHDLTIPEYMANIGYLNEKLLAGHCVWMTDRDLYLLKMFDVKVAHQAVSNQYLGSGVAPITRMTNLGITVGLGTDDPNCNDSVNMFSDMKHAALIQKAVNVDAAAMTAEKVLEMATIDGARCVGMEHDIGSIEKGKKADIILVNLNYSHLKPCHHLPAVMVYQANGSEVDTTIIDGRVLMTNGELTFMSEQEEAALRDEAQACSDAIVERAGMHKLKNRGWQRFRI